MVTQRATGLDHRLVARLRRDIYQAARHLVRRYLPPGDQRAAVEAVVATLRPPSGRSGSELSTLLVPVLVYAAIRDADPAPAAVSLAAMLALLFRATGIIDDLADGERSPFWGGRTEAEMNLVAYDLVCVLPQLVLADLPVSCVAALRMQRALGNGLGRASAGQRGDFRLRNRAEVSAAEVEQCAAAKGGELIAIATALPAILAGATESVVDSFAAFGHALGTAQSIAEDYLDLFCKEHSSDLRTGTRSFPIASHLERQVGDARTQFLDLLARAMHDDAAQAAIRQRLSAGGEIQRCAIAVASYSVKACQQLKRAAAREPAATALNAIARRLPLLHRAPMTHGERPVA